ncbi:MULTISPECIES: TetR family transcriptional regulator [unclassified Thalassospira]|jgi:AcrR family transcriptional regulator|uniref:TetR family transcriptional regulator n=1 Tax=unclassified Thalassospira TaxID=2648997 RepID=UPI000A1DB063|nr:TetR family transcriptional regulator [Thalassospira sp. MCCC 1A01428]
MENECLVRARSHEQKLRRRNDIIDAAEALFLEGEGQLPSAAEVAKKANLAKGTLYLYFSSKEALFLEVLRRFFKGWSENNLDMIEQEALRPPAERDALRVARQFVDYLVKRSRFLHLASLSHGVLEQGADDESVLIHKRYVAAMVKRTADALSEIYAITAQQARNLMANSFALVLGLWQMSQVPARVVVLMRQNALEDMIIDFSQSAETAVIEFWRAEITVMKQSNVGQQDAPAVL